MKKIIALVIVLIPLMAQAGEVSVSLNQYSRMADDDIYQVGTWNGIQISYSHDSNVYYFIGQDTAVVYPNGRAFDYIFTAVGIGFKKKVTSGFNVFGQAGIAKIDDTLGKKNFNDIEALTYYFNERISQQLPSGYHQAFDSFGVTHDDYAAAISLGAELVTEITKNFSAGISMSYRGLKFHESLSAYRNDWDAHNATLSPGQTPTYWEFGIGRNYSSFNTGINLTYSF